jgi:hypothetical protein
MTLHRTDGFGNRSLDLRLGVSEWIVHTHLRGSRDECTIMIVMDYALCLVVFLYVVAIECRYDEIGIGQTGLSALI